MSNSRAEPYVGPRSFQKEEKEIFFGRDMEKERLLSLLIANRCVVLFAQSGTGKTSLVNAGVTDLLQTEGFQSVLPTRVIGPVNEFDDKKRHKNVFEVNAAIGLLDFIDGDVSDLEPEPSLYNVIRRISSYDEEKPTLVIFDQFEELFTTITRQYHDKDVFIDTIIELMNEFRDLRYLFVVREEWLAEIDERSHRFDDNLRARIRLRGLKAHQADDAINEPLNATNTGIVFEKKARAKLIEDLLSTNIEDDRGNIRVVVGEYIEPVQLQVVCAALWSKHDPHERYITENDLNKIGSVNEVLSKYYDDCVTEASMGRFEDELFLRNWFEHQLITSSETRGFIHLSNNGAAGVPVDIVKILQSFHILKLESRSGSRWVELSHDRLIKPIKLSNAQWRELRGEVFASSQPKTLSRIRMTGALRLGVTLAPPFCYEDENGLLTGEAIVMTREVFKELGVFRIEPVFSEFVSLADGLESGAFDIANDGIFITAERQKRCIFSLPTLVCGFGFLVRKGNPKKLHSYEDILNHPDAVFGASNGTDEYDVAIDLGIPKNRVVGFAKTSMGLNALMSGRIDAFVTLELDLPFLVKLAGSENVEVASPFSDPIIDGQAYRGVSAMMLRKSDTALAQEINEVLKKLVGTERHANLVAPFGITREMLPDAWGRSQ